jgi:signal transduction histidine kinase
MSRPAIWRTPASRDGAYPGYVLQGVYAWLRRHPSLADWALAGLLAAFSVYQAYGGVVVSVLLAATVVARRRYPLAAFVAATVLAAAQAVFGLKPGITDLAIVFVLYTLAASRPRRISVPGLAVCLLVSVPAVTQSAAVHQGPLWAAVVGAGGLTLTAWVLGDSMALRRAYDASLEDRAARAEAERDAQARIAAAAERGRELQERRGRAVDESTARLRRIERDLHDGAQVRLTALAMTLGEIMENLDADTGEQDDGSRTRMLVAAAHRNAKETLAELRDLARGIHPPVLDRGLGAALSALAETCATPTELKVSIAERPSPAIEAIAYFCAAELLANVVKHSGANHADITVRDQDRGLLMTVADDGAGEARLVRGGGLAGLLERVQTVDGRFGIDSPPGGPTIITIELPGHA